MKTTVEAYYLLSCVGKASMFTCLDSFLRQLGKVTLEKDGIFLTYLKMYLCPSWFDSVNRVSACSFLFQIENQKNIYHTPRIF